MKKEEEKVLRNVSLVGGASFFNDVGSEMITPLLPFYVTALGGGGLAVGIISGLREGLQSIFKVIGGWLSDRTGKRNVFIFFGYFLSIIFRFLLGIANSWQYVLGLVSFERFGKLRDAPRDALLSQSAHKKGRAFGIHQTMDTAGGVVGTLLVIFLFWKFQFPINHIILMAAGISILSLVPLFFVKEVRTEKTKHSLFEGIRKLNPKLKYFIFVSAVFAFANFGLYMFMILKAKEVTGNIILPLILYLVFSIICASFVTPFGILSDRIGRKKVLLAGYILFFAVLLGFLFFNSLFSLVVLFILYGMVFSMTEANQKAFISDFSKDMKGTSHGFFGFVLGMSNIIGGLIAGVLWDINYTTMLIYLSCVSLISIILFFFVKGK